jgi:flagellar export protein FliJ
MRHDALIKLRRFEVNEKRQKVGDIELMIADLKRMADDLDHQIKIEQDACGIHDVNHYAYPTFAKAAVQRRDNLRASVAGLQAKLEEAQIELEEAMEELKKSEMAEERSLAAEPGERTLAASPGGRQGSGFGMARG